MNGLTAGGAPETTDKPESTDKPQTTQKPETNVPQTGDSAQLMLYVAALASAVCLLTGAFALRRKNQGDK